MLRQVTQSLIINNWGRSSFLLKVSKGKMVINSLLCLFENPGEFFRQVKSS